MAPYISAEANDPAASSNASTSKAKRPVFEDDIVPVLRAYCWNCHGGEARKAELDLRTFALLTKGGKNGAVVSHGDAADSLLYQKLANGQMPPGERLKPTEAHVSLIKRWIDSGARSRVAEHSKHSDTPKFELSDVDREWWAFQKPERSRVPDIGHGNQANNPIDQFLLRQLDEQGLSFSPEADRVTLARRAYLDVIGLPPDPEELAAFTGDDSPAAYERLVDRLLSSPHFGERWGRHWLDACGYVDTLGGDNDATIIEPRAGSWRYRDYVVRSINDDKPFDRFLQEQIAGDELVDWRNANTYSLETRELLIATGFLRQAADVTYAPELNTADIRHQVLYDSVQIFSSNVLGLTLHCARCHDHKFDPISQADYYRLLSVFAPGYNVHDWKHSKERVLPDVSAKVKEEIDAHNAQIDKKVGDLEAEVASAQKMVEKTIRETKLAGLANEVRADVKAAVETPADKRTENQKQLVEKFGKQVAVTDADIEKAMDATNRARIEKCREEMAALKSAKRTHGDIQAFWDVGPPPPTYVYKRGNSETPGQPVTAGYVAVLNPLDQSAEMQHPHASKSSSGYRTQLANWLTLGEHPLTARVIVNRIWQHYFGIGIVATPDNFGVSGEGPSHPELLDWLATEFVRRDWSVKQLHRLIVTAAAYRQASRGHADSNREAIDPREVDPENRLLWRMTLRRLDSEVIRDRILATSGSLNPTLGGEPVPIKPHASGTVEIDHEKAKDPEQQHRRSLYLLARRNYQPTQLQVFDQPSVAHNCTARTSSAVVLQSLTMLNSKFVFKQSDRFAARVKQRVGDGSEARVREAVRLALCREPSAEEVELGLRLLRDQAARHRTGEDLSAEEADDRALGNLCHMLLNTSEFLYVP